MERRAPARSHLAACHYLESRPELNVSSNGAGKPYNEGGCEEHFESCFHDPYSEEQRGEKLPRDGMITCVFRGSVCGSTQARRARRVFHRR